MKNASFPMTRWSRVAYARDPGHPRARAALEELFQLYWYPIYSFLRRRFAHEDSEDLTQAFFVYALEHGTINKADASRGRFRTFILACLENFVRDEWRRASASKRSGLLVPFDGTIAETRYVAETIDDLTPEKIFERRLAEEILAGAMRELEADAAAEGKLQILNALQGHLSDDAAEGYASIAVNLNIPVGTLKSHAYRFRKRLRRLLTQRVDHLVANEDDVQSEMQALEDSL